MILGRGSGICVEGGDGRGRAGCSSPFRKIIFVKATAKPSGNRSRAFFKPELPKCGSTSFGFAVTVARTGQEDRGRGRCLRLARRRRRIHSRACSILGLSGRSLRNSLCLSKFNLPLYLSFLQHRLYRSPQRSHGGSDATSSSRSHVVVRAGTQALCSVTVIILTARIDAPCLFNSLRPLCALTLFRSCARTAMCLSTTCNHACQGFLVFLTFVPVYLPLGDGVPQITSSEPLLGRIWNYQPVCVKHRTRV